jgi:uncharacterized protein (TIGR02246 family)
MDVVQEMIAAYNAHDLERCLSYYVPDVKMENGEGHVFEGQAGLRAFYGPLVAQSPNLHVEVLNRIHVGEWDVVEMQLTGMNMAGIPPEEHAMQIFRVVDNKIVYSRFFEEAHDA